MELVDDESVSNDSDNNSTDRERRIAFYIKTNYSFDKRNKAAEQDKHDRHHSRKRREVVDVEKIVDDNSVNNDGDSNSTDRERRIALSIKAKYSFDKWNKAVEHDKHNRHNSRKRRDEFSDSTSNSTDRERRIAFYIKAKYSFDKRNKATEHDKHDRHHSRKRREVVDVVELVDDESVSNDSDNNSTDRERIAFYINAKHSFDK